MNKFFLISALLAIVSGAQAEVITLTPNAAGVGGGITGPGTTVSGNLVTWNSTTGAAIADSGIMTGAVTLPASYAFVFDATVTAPTFNASGQAIALGVGWSSAPTLNATAQGAIYSSYGSGLIMMGRGSTCDATLRNYSGNSGLCVLTGTQNTQVYGSVLPSATNANPLGSSSLFFSAAYLQSLILEGSSSGVDTISSGNNTATSRTVTVPSTGSASDTLALLGANQTFPGANTFSGTTTLSGSVLFSSTGTPAAFTANGQVEINAGTTVPTFNGSFMNTLAIGGVYTSSLPNLTSGGGNIFVYGSSGLGLQGNSIYFMGPTGSVVTYASYKGITTNGLLANSSGNLWFNNTAPTSSSNAASIAANGSLAFSFKPAAMTQNYITLTLPTQTGGNGWVCQFNNLNAASTGIVKQTGTLSTTAATVTYFSAIGTAANWPNTTDVITALCAGS